MARFCNVAPIHILEELKEIGELPQSHLLLAHDVVQYPTRYERLFACDFVERMNQHIILDNSAYELKASVDTAMVWEAAKIVLPNCVVLPDVYLDGYATYHATAAVVKDWLARAERMSNKVEPSGIRVQLMIMPQGESWDQWIRCAFKFIEPQFDEVSWWGIPRNVREVLHISRRDAIDICHALNRLRKIHLFGFSDDYMDDFMSAHHLCGAESIDSTTPARAGSLEKEFSLDVKLPSRGDWWQTARFDKLIVNNLRYAERLFRGFP